MNLTYLKYFYDAAMHGSISHAAKLNFVTQSAVSQGIRKLEASLKMQLIMHQKNHFVLTKEGEIVFNASKEIFQSLIELEHKVHKGRNEYLGPLTVATTHSIAISLLPALISKLKKQAPEIMPRIIIKQVPQIKELIKRGEVDVAIVLNNDDFSSFGIKTLFKGVFRMYQPVLETSSHKQGFILPEESQEINLLKNYFEKKYGYSLPIEMQVSSWEVIASLIDQGLGSGFLPDFLILNNTRYKNLKIYDLGLPDIKYEMVAIYNLQKHLSKNAQLLLNSAH